MASFVCTNFCIAVSSWAKTMQMPACTTSGWMVQHGLDLRKSFVLGLQALIFRTSALPLGRRAAPQKQTMSQHKPETEFMLPWSRRAVIFFRAADFLSASGAC
jgi:hypothetical protein